MNLGSSVEYIPVGIFNIDDVEKTEYTIKFTCFDNMIKFEKPYFSSLGDTPILKEVVNELSSKTGVQFIGSLPAYTVKKLEGFTCREILSYVASICGGNAIITRDGKFTIVYPRDVNYSITGANYIDYKREDVKYKIGKLACQVGDGILEKGTLSADSRELQFENPWVTTNILNDLYTKLNGFEYLGYSMKWQGDIALDLGDIITCTDIKGVVRKLPIFNQKFNFTGGLTSEIGAKGETENQNSFSSSGSNVKKLERVVTELAIVNKALVDVAYIGDLTANNIKFDTASGGTLNLQNLLSNFITGENGQFLNITSSNVVIANAVIKDAMIENVSVNKLKAGSIDTNKINLTSADGGLSIVGPTMQFKDSSKRVRLQLGQDTSGNFSFILRGTDGTTTLIDHTGIKEKAIADKLIKSNMVADNAIGEQQLNYSSLVTGLNKDTNTSLIKASKVAIDLTGQSLEVSFNSLKSNVDSKESRNLVRNYTNWRSKDKARLEVTINDGYVSLKRIGSTGCHGYVPITLPISSGEKYTFSIKVRSSVSRVIQFNLYNINQGTGRSRIIDTTIQADEWTVLNNIITLTNVDGDSTGIFLTTTIMDLNQIVDIEWCKLEKGENSNPIYSEAPEDVDSKVEANTTAITVAQGKIEGLISESSITKGDVTTLKNNYTSLKATVDGINTTVASHTSSIGKLTTDLSGVSGKVTTVETKQATLEQNLNGFKTTVSNTYSTKTELGAVDGKFKDYSTTTQMNSAISQSANSVKTEVNNTFVSKTDANNVYATKSSLVQASDSIIASFKASGGYNLVRNSTGQNGNNLWKSTSGRTIGGGGQSSLPGATSKWLYLDNGTNTTEGWAYSSRFKFKANTKYTLSGWVLNHTKCPNFDVYVLGSSVREEDDTSSSYDIIHTIAKDKNTNGGWEKISVSFTTASNEISGFVRIDNNGYNAAGTNLNRVYWTALMLNEGEEMPWSPHPSEVYDGSTIIDASGVTVKNGALKVENSSGVTMLEGTPSGQLFAKDGALIVASDMEKAELKIGYRTTMLKEGIKFNFDSDQNGIVPYEGSIIMDYVADSPGIIVRGVKTIEGAVAGAIGVKAAIDVTGSASFGGNLNVSGSSDRSITISSTRKAVLNLNADTDNSDESDTAYIRMTEDGGATVSVIGLIGDANTNPSGGTSTGTDANGLFIGTISANNINIAANNVTKLKILATENTISSRCTIECRDVLEVTGFEAWRGAGHSRFSQSDTAGSMRLELFSSGTTVARNYLFGTSNFYPNGSITLGAASYRWGQIYSTVGAISTSDSKLKENIKPIPRSEARVMTIDNQPTSLDFYNYVKGTPTYTFNYKKQYSEDTKEWLGVLADEIPNNIFNKIGMVSKTEEEYQKELKDQEEAKKLLESTPIPLIYGDEVELNNLENKVVEGTELTYRELKERAERVIEEPVRMLNSSSQIAMLQEVLSIALNKIEFLEERVLELGNL